jgi:hypothetical protein
MRHLTKDDIMGDKPFFHATIDSSLDIPNSLYSNYLVPFQAKTSKSCMLQKDFNTQSYLETLDRKTLPMKHKCRSNYQPQIFLMAVCGHDPPCAPYCIKQVMR